MSRHPLEVREYCRAVTPASKSCSTGCGCVMAKDHGGGHRAICGARWYRGKRNGLIEKRGNVSQRQAGLLKDAIQVTGRPIDVVRCELIAEIEKQHKDDRGRLPRALIGRYRGRDWYIVTVPRARKGFTAGMVTLARPTEDGWLVYSLLSGAEVPIPTSAVRVEKGQRPPARGS